MRVKEVALTAGQLKVLMKREGYPWQTQHGMFRGLAMLAC